jgi:hypothetical protein
VLLRQAVASIVLLLVLVPVLCSVDAMWYSEQTELLVTVGSQHSILSYCAQNRYNHYLLLLAPPTTVTADTTDATAAMRLPLLSLHTQAVLVEMRAQGCATADDYNHYLTAALNSSDKHVGKYRSALLRECMLDMLKGGFAPDDSSFVRVMEVCVLQTYTVIQ